jgi:hypothetical protein
MADKLSLTAGDFVARIFGQAEGNVFITSLPNVRGEGRSREWALRNRAEIDGLVAKHDRPGSGQFFCVSTLRADAEPDPDKAGSSIRRKTNVAQIVLLHGDVDLKGVTIGRDEILQRLVGLEMPPSLIVWSGRGFHCYWLLNEPLEADEETLALVEGLNDQIADVIAGDAVKDVCRLLRLPGSHNTKDGGWHAVEVVRDQFEPRYELSDLEDWLSRQSPVIERKLIERGPRASQQAIRNVFERVAAEHSFSIPIDVDARLAAMSYGGGGDTSVHNTQLSVSASLLSRGEAVDDVVELILQATKAAAGQDGAKWRWDREEKAIRDMCRDWQRKHPGRAEKPKVVRLEANGARAQARSADRDDILSEAVEGSDPASVHDIGAARAKRDSAKPRKEKKTGGSPVHVVLGEAVLAAMAERGEAVLFTDFGAYLYRTGLWTLQTGSDAQWLDVQIETACRALRIDSTNKIRSETRGYIRSNPELWRDSVPWDQHGKVPTRTGLIDPLTGAVEAARAEHYCTWRVEADYDPAAACPAWLEMAGDTFGDRVPSVRDEHVLCLQEVFGAALIDVRPRGLSKALCLVGGPSSGKSGLLEVGTGLFGDDPITVDIESTSGTHGTMPFVRRAPWVLHEAFNQGKWLVSSIVKAMITGEPVAINVKNKPIVSRRIRAPIFWATNHPPQFREATRAMVSRMIIMRCQRVFNDRDPVGVGAMAAKQGLDRPSTLVLRDERSGVLNWCLVGLRRAMVRGVIEEPQESKDAADEIHRDSNLVAGFIEECIDFDPNRRIAVPDFCAAFSAWWLENKGEDRTVPSNDSIGRAVNALADPRIGSHVKETKDKTRRYLCGVILNGTGRGFWAHALDLRALEGKTSSATDKGGEVNSYIPEGWDARPSVMAMRAAQAGDTSFSGSNRRSATSGGSVTEESVTTEVSVNVSPGLLSPIHPTDPSGESEF